MLINRKVQYLAGLSACLGYLHAGAVIAWVSPAVVKLRDGESDLVITKSEESWIVSLQVLCAILGCLIGQVMNERIGRRRTMLAAAVPGILGAGVVVLAKSAELIYLARLLQGTAVGIISLATIIYITEITDKEIRGPLGMMGQVTINLGYLLMYGVGPFVSYDVLNGIVLVLPIVALLAAYWIPESPYYYLITGRTEEAREVLMDLKGIENAMLVEEQLSIMQSSVKESMENKSSMFELFTKKKYRKALYIVTGLRIIQFMTGWVAIMTYLQTIFKESSSLSGPIVSIVYGFVQLGACVAGSFLTRWVGRRPLMFTSCLGVALTLTMAGLYFFLRNSIKIDQNTLRSISALPLLSILAFNIFYMIGIGTLPNVMQAELFPINVKSQASSASTMFACVLSFAVAKCYGTMKEFFGQDIVLWFFAAVAYIGVVFIYVYLPETKGKTLEEVQNIMRRNETKPMKSDTDID